MTDQRPIYTQEEAFESCVKYFDGDELASQVWINKYALKDSDGNLYEKNPQQMHDRIASEIHRIEKRNIKIQCLWKLSKVYYTISNILYHKDLQ